MVDHAKRQILADAIRDLAAGHLHTNDYACLEPKFHCDDPAVMAVFRFGDGLYSDFVSYLRGRSQLSGQSRADVERCITFLQSDLDYPWPDADDPFWERAGVETSITRIAGVCFIIGLLLNCAGRVIFGFLLIFLGGACVLLFVVVDCWTSYCWRKKMSIVGDLAAWPFLSQSSYAQIRHTNLASMRFPIRLDAIQRLNSNSDIHES